MKKLILMLSLVLCLASCDSKGSKDKDGGDYNITGKARKDAKSISDALLQLAEDEDFEGANDLFGEILDNYDTPEDADLLWQLVGEETQSWTRKEVDTVGAFLEDALDNRKCKNYRRFYDLVNELGSSYVDQDSLKYADSVYQANYYAPEEAW